MRFSTQGLTDSKFTATESATTGSTTTASTSKSTLTGIQLPRLQPQKPRSTNLELSFSPSVEDLPFAIIDEIAKWLPLTSSALLTISSHTLRDILGKEHLIALRSGSKDERAAFWNTLDFAFTRGLYGLYYQKLHPIVSEEEHIITVKR